MTERKSSLGRARNGGQYYNEADPDPPLETYSSSDDDSSTSESIQLQGTNLIVRGSTDIREGLVHLQKVKLISSDYARIGSETNPFRKDPNGGNDNYSPDAFTSSCIENDGGISCPRSSDEESSPVQMTPTARTSHVGSYPTVRTMQQHAPFKRMIDNTALFYVPLRLRCDVVAMCRPEVIARCPQLLQELNADLFRCLRVLPLSVHGLVRRTKIWVNASYQYGPVDEPQTVGHSTAHHHDGWLIWARDKREKTLGIEIYNCFDYRQMRLHWNGAGLILHELCHLIHQLALKDGLENEYVKSVYKAAKKSGRYDEILRRDWAGRDCETDMAYCMVNHKEFFAEMSVTYLADNYKVLDRAPTSIEACSPPLMSPTVIERMRNKLETQEQLSLLQAAGVSPTAICLRSFSSACCDDDLTIDSDSYERQHLVGRVFGSGTSKFLSNLFFREDRTPPHCNKFFPFTRGQLGVYDPDLLSGLSKIWQTIECWEDYDCDSGKCSRLGCLGWKGEGTENSSVWL